MSRTACCFLALGISVAAFAAACGDDDDGGGGTGGNGGTGASGGSGGGTAGSGSAGEAGGGAGGGTAGTGNAGTGNAGTGNAGTGNAGTGNGGAAGSGVEPDGGVPDSGSGEPDSGVVDAGGNQGPADSGINGDCVPDFGTSTALCAAQNSQSVVIARVTFNGDGTASVVLRSTDGADPGGFTLGDIQVLCTGPADGDCVDPADHATLPTQLALNAEITLTNVPGLTADEGEIVLATGLPSDVAATTFAYTAWGTSFVSAAPGGVGLLSWEDRAVLDGFWTLDDRIDVGATQNTYVCGGNTGDADNGDTSLAAGFGICTADQF
jgi:hypothetical protein